jgi:sulfonate dioxygenase
MRQNDDNAAYEGISFEGGLLCFMSTMSSTVVATTTIANEGGNETVLAAPEHRFSHLLPTFSQDEHYPPLELFDHVDPGSRALAREDPNAFLVNAVVSVLTPRFGSEVRGVNLATLNAEGRDQLALYVARRGVIVFRDQDDFINAPAERYLEWGRHFGR